MNRLVYISHAYASDPVANSAAMRSICREVAAQGDIPICPAIYFTAFLNDRDPDQRALGLEMALALVPLCRELRIYGRELSGGMQLEIIRADAAGIPMVRVEYGAATPPVGAVRG